MLKKFAAGATTALMAGAFVLVGATGASATSTDQSEAEGRVLSGGGVVNLNGVASLDPAYSANPSSPADDSNPLSATVLNALNIDLGGGIQLFGPNGVIGVGALGQYAKAGADGDSYASSGAVQSDGSIAVGPSGDTSDAYIDATNLLSNAGLAPATKTLISKLRVELGALTAVASQTPGQVASGDYQIAGGKILVTSPALATLTSSLNTTLGQLSDQVNAITGPTGTLGSALGGIKNDLIDPLQTALGKVSLGLVTLSNTNLTASLSVDLKAAAHDLLTGPLLSTDGATSIDLSTGTISIDLAELHGAPDQTLNNLAPNTDLLDAAVLQGALNSSINSALNQLPALLVTTVNNAINNATLSLHLTADAKLLGIPLATVDAVTSGTVGGFTRAPGATPPTVNADGTKALGTIPLGTLVTPIVDTLTSDLLPAVVTPLENGITGLGIGDGLFQPVVTTATTALQPLLTAINDVVSLTANVQEKPGEFTTAGASSANSFTERALSITLLPNLDTPLAEVNLASATVRTSAIAVAITSPTDGTKYTVPDAGSTKSVPVTGTGQPGASISVTVGGTPQTTTVGSDGTWTVTFPGLAVGDYTATATQTIGDDVSTDSTTFTIGVEATTDTTGTTSTSTTDTTGTTSTSTTDTTGTTSTSTTDTTGTTSTSTTDTTGTTSTTDTTGTTSTTDTTGTTSTTPGDTTSTTTGTTSTSTSTTPGDTTSTTTGTTSTSTTPGDTTSTTQGSTSTTDTTGTTSTSTTPGDTTSTTQGSTSTTDTTGTTSTSTTPGDTTSTTTGTTSTSTTPGDTTSTTQGTTSTSTSTTPGDTTSTTQGTTSTSTSTSTSTTDAGQSPSSSVKYKSVVRGTGVSQIVYGTGFKPGESVSGTVHSTSIPLKATAADASGNVSWSVPIGASFELGSHSADLSGSDSGAVSAANNHTQFTVTAATATTTGGGNGLADTGSNTDWALPALFGLFLAGGAAMMFARRKRSAKA